MGDRVVVKFISPSYTPTEGWPEVYLHWAGSSVGEILEAAAPIMRKGDPSYAIARFIGKCHEMTGSDQGLSLGVGSAGYFGDQGDNGIVTVDVDTGEVSHKCPYDEDEHFNPPLPKSLTLGGF